MAGKKKKPAAGKKKTPAKAARKPAEKKPSAKKPASKAPKKAAARPGAKKPAVKKTPKPAPKAKPVSRAASPKKASAKPAKKAPSVKARPAAKRRPTVQEAEELRKLELRRELIRRREEILKEAKTEIAKYIKGENRQLVETALDDGDWSVVDLSEDINLRKLSAHQATLKHIDAALRKLDEGTYGVCEECGDEINIERLKVLPFAVYCRDCQEKREIMEALEREGTV
jgi:DnaK suppressor protein